MDDAKKMEPRPPVDPARVSDEGTTSTEDFKADVQRASEELAAQVAAFKEFWTIWMPGGLRKRKRYRTKPHGMRRAERRRKNKVARASRKRNRPHKKRRR